MSFLTRISSLPPERPTQAVVRSLDQILNSRKGYAFHDEDFGLGEFNSFLADEDSIDRLSAELKRQVARYEPRIRDASVAFLGRSQQHWLMFKLTGRLRVGAALESKIDFRLRMHILHHHFDVQLLSHQSDTPQ